MKIPLIKPFMPPDVKARVGAVLDSGYLTEGPVTREFEAAVADFIECAHAIAVCNCTVGLETALRALGIGPGDEVIVPDYTYPASASAVEIAGARIVLVDVDPKTMIIDAAAIEAAVTASTKAIMPVSIFGNPVNYNELAAIKQKHALFIIEDAACSIGASFAGTRVGNLADISVFSLHPRKFITTGEGGIITTNQTQWAAWINSYKHFGMAGTVSRSMTQFERIGTNYKLSNLQAAIGLAQMQHIDALLDRRRSLAERYHTLLAEHPGIELPGVVPGGRHSFQSCCVFVENRDSIIQQMKARGIETQIGSYALHMHAAYHDNPNCRIEGDMRGSRWAFDHCLTLPLYHEMTETEQDFVIEQLRQLL